MPKRAVALAFGFLAFLAVVLSTSLWALLSGDAGSQRGIVLTSVIAQDVVVRLADGQSAAIGPGFDATFVVRREDFPSTVRVTDPDGALILERELEYADLADADFRMSVDENGFFPTNQLRDTPVRGAATPRP